MSYGPLINKYYMRRKSGADSCPPRRPRLVSKAGAPPITNNTFRIAGVPFAVSSGLSGPGLAQGHNSQTDAHFYLSACSELPGRNWGQFYNHSCRCDLWGNLRCGQPMPVISPPTFLRLPQLAPGRGITGLSIRIVVMMIIWGSSPRVSIPQRRQVRPLGMRIFFLNLRLAACLVRKVRPLGLPRGAPCGPQK